MRAGTEHGVAAWSSTPWRTSAVAWLDAQLAAAGIERTGEVEHSHLRPWGTVLRAPTTDGPVWLKAAAPATAFEVALYELLAHTVPDRVLTPIASDPARGWVLLPDGGPSLGERKAGIDLVEDLVAAVVEYGRLQRRLEPCVDQLLGLGVADMRPAAMPARFDDALAAVRRIADAADDPTAGTILPKVAAMRPTVDSWCERLAASPVPPSLDHNDLHPWNILGESGDVRYYDWGDAVVAHPFAAVLVPLGFVQRGLGATLEDPGFLRARDAYLDVFADLAPRAELVETLALACRVAKIARALTWERAVRAALEQGEPVERTWATASAETLASILDDSYLGGG
jgi:Phosphotransferase enzyme family